jgi:hypothetical protein
MANIQSIITNGNGNVLIGTTTDNGSKLNVNGSYYGTGNITLITAGYPLIDLGVTTSNYFRINFDNPNDQLIIGKNGASSFILSASGAATFSSSVAATSAAFSGNVTITTANTPELLLTHSNTSKTFLIAVDGSNAFFRANSTNNILFQVAGGTTALTLASSQAATFSSSVTAVNGFFNQQKVGSGVESLDALSLRLFGTNAIGDSLNVKFINVDGTQVASISGLLGPDNIAYGSLAFSTRNYNTDSMIEVMRIDNRARVGIGTTEPAKKLVVQSSSQTWASAPQIAFYDTETAQTDSRNWTIGAISTNWGSLNIASSTAAGGDPTTPRFTITKDGNVGIGTTAPNLSGGSSGSTILTVSATSSARNSILELNGTRTTLNDYVAYVRMFNNGAATPVADIAAIRGSSDTTGSLTLSTSNAERLRIDSAGNVGIGTTAPLVKLRVQSSGSTFTTPDNNDVAAVSIYNSNNSSANAHAVISLRTQVSGGSPFISFDVENETGYSVGMDNASNQFRIAWGWNSLTNYPAICITQATSPNVLIGTTTDAGYKLEVSGTSYFSGLAHFGQTATSGSAFRWGSLGTAVSTDTMLCMNQLWNGSGWTILNASYGTTAINLGSAVASPTIRFETGGANTSATTKMIILNNGNVGIGTTSPSSELEVSSSTLTELKVTESGSSVTTMVQSSTSYGWVGTKTNHTMYIGANDGAKITVLTSGNVGIGTTAPLTTLSVFKTVAFSTSSPQAGEDNIFLTSATAAGSGVFGGSIGFSRNGFHDRRAAAIASVQGTADEDQIGLAFFTHPTIGGADAIAEAMRISYDGNVGIGTTAPAAKLEVIGSIRNKNASANDNYSQLSTTESTLTISTYSVNTGSYPAPIIFSPNLSERMRITDAGNVGIGTDNPTHNLEIKYAGSVYQKLNADFGIGYFGMESADDSMRFVTAQATPIQLYTDNTERLRITATGNVLIGTATDSGFKLRVNGEILADDDIRIFNTFALGLNGTDNNWRIGRNTITDTGWLTGNTLQVVVFGSSSGQGFQVVNSNGTALFEIDGVAGASRFTNALGVGVNPSGTAGRIDASNDIVAYSSSDLRLKENIKPIENALDKVKALTGVEFDWKAEHKEAHGYEGHDTGVIAQEVKEVMPTAVRVNDTGYLAVRYEKLIGLLVEANKELAARVEELEKKLK